MHDRVMQPTRLPNDLDQFLAGLLEKVFPLAMIFGTLAVVASFYRAAWYGWYRTAILHLALYLLAMAAFLARRWFREQLVFALMLACVSVIAVQSLRAFALAGPGIMLLLFVCALTGIFLGKRAGMIVLIGSGLLIAVFGFIACTGIGAGANPNLPAYLSSPFNWTIQLLMFVMFLTPLILAVNEYQSRMLEALRDLRANNALLEREVSTRRETEERLRKSEEKYRAIFENAIEGIFQTTPDGGLLNANPSLARIAGYESPEQLLASMTNVETQLYVNPDDRRAIIQDLAQHGFVEGFETKGYRKDGSILWASINARAVRDERGEILRIEGTLEDVTKRKLAEIALQESEEKYRCAVESALIGFYIIQDNVFRFVNKKFCDMFGYEYREIVDTLCPLEMVDQSDRNRVSKLMQKRLADKDSPVKQHEGKALRKDGAVILVRAMAKQFTYNGKPALVGTVIDVTEQLTLEAQLRQAQKMEAIGTLAGGVAHDFNNMLTVILGYAEIIKLRLSQNDPLLDSLAGIENAALRSKEITNQLLAFSRKQIISPKVMDLNYSILGVEKTLSRLIGEHITLRFVPRKNLWKIHMDPSQVHQVLFNLAVNAHDAMPHGGTLVIETSNVELDEGFCQKHAGATLGAYVRLRVSDDGVGMDEETLSHIFEPFFTTKPIGKGTGLGLATVYGVIKQNNGFIEVTSKPKRGTRFGIYFPRTLGESASQEADKPSPEPDKTGTILLVEDDAMVRSTTTELLQAAGYEVITPSTPMEALALCETMSDPIDLVITDVVMPLLSGKEFKDRFDAIRPGIHTLFMSGYPSDVVALHGVLESGIHFIQKPFTAQELIDKIRETMKKR